MIFRLDSSLIDKAYAHVLASCLRQISEKKHKIDYDNPAVWEFVETQVLTTANLGTDDINLIRCNLELRDIQNTDRNYYREVLVGFKIGMVDLNTLSIILNTASCIVLENSTYDWCVIKRWLEFVKNDPCYKDVNRKVCDAVCRKWIIPEHAGGGNGTISQRIGNLVANTYFGAGQLKITTIYDSDKISSTDAADHNAALKKYLSENGYKGHEWDKREIENYIPLRIYKNANLVNKDKTEPDKTPSVWDYTCIDKHPYFKKRYKKDKMPKLVEWIDKAAVKEAFSAMSYINPVDNHPISELQYVIFLLAKYI